MEKENDPYQSFEYGSQGQSIKPEHRRTIKLTVTLLSMTNGHLHPAAFAALFGRHRQRTGYNVFSAGAGSASLVSVSICVLTVLNALKLVLCILAEALASFSLYFLQVPE